MLSAADRAARERKQRIFVLVGGLLLVALLAIQLPRLLGGSSGTSAATPTTPSGIAPGDTRPTPSSTTRSAPVALVSGDRPLAPGAGQLSSFSEFRGKDPFVQQVHFSGNSVPASTGSTAKAEGKGKQAETKTSTKGFTVGGSPTASVTVISVNGSRQALVPGMAFPSSDPVFVLVSEELKTKSVVVGIAGGAYASGSKTTKLSLGKPLVLVNTTTGARYKLMLVAVGNGQAAAPAANKGAKASKSKALPSTP